MDEQIDILKGLMNGEYFSYNGEFYDIPELKTMSLLQQNQYQY
jgi:alkanesulfonate monooxygenase SsuD/methylene tetrahydromethanopterin reductase-like flavin-dependent oxidoreductase (luciferase family)